jgi:hypothetical protein
VGSHDDGGRIASTVSSAIDVDMWHIISGTNGGHAVDDSLIYAQMDYGINNGIWATTP